MKHVIIVYATVLVCAQSSFTPQEVMVDVTNDFGVCILQLVSSRRENIAFSPYGVVSVGLVLYEGASGTTAAEIHNTLRLPWDRHITRIGFRDLHRYLKSYFTNDGFLRGLVLSKPNVILHWNYTRQLQFYGFDLKPADTPTKVPSTAQTTPMGQTTKPPLTTELTTTPISSQQPTMTITTQQATGQPETETATKPPTTAPSTNAATTESQTLQTGDMSKVPTTSPPTENTVTTKPETQETEQTTNAPLTSTTTAKSETADETTQQNEEVSMGIETSSSATGPITSNGNNEKTEDATSVTQANSPTTNVIPTNLETQQTEEAPKDSPTTDGANTQNEETITTLKVQTSVSPQAETRTTSAVSETSKTETTMAATDQTKVEMEGRVDSDDSSMESESQTNVQTTEALTEKIEITSVSPIMTSISQTISENVSAGTSTPMAETTRIETTQTEVNDEDKVESETTMISAIPQTTQFTASSESEGITKEATESRTATTVSSQSEITTESQNTETQSLTEAMTTIPQTSPTETMTTTIGSTISVPMNMETETSNEINTQQTTSETGETANEDGISRKRRALLHSKGIAPEHREGVSNWVPHYQDPRWNYHAPLENWFFSYFGGEKVPIITYSAYLPFAYLGDLATLALQLPLDDPRYYMLILLPQERNGLEKLLYSLQWCPIRGIINQLKLTAVYATVPVFTIVKHVNLVPALAKLGVLSVFDPSTADLSAMSPEKGIFVRTIEQVVTVSLRKYFANYRWFEAKPSEVEQHFIANHPFAYFVLDKETQVTLMTGTIVNPTAYNQ